MACYTVLLAAEERNRGGQARVNRVMQLTTSLMVARRDVEGPMTTMMSTSLKGRLTSEITLLQLRQRQERLLMIC
jgi:hypothetical protein